MLAAFLMAISRHFHPYLEYSKFISKVVIFVNIDPPFSSIQPKLNLIKQYSSKWKRLRASFLLGFFFFLWRIYELRLEKEQKQDKKIGQKSNFRKLVKNSKSFSSHKTPCMQNH